MGVVQFKDWANEAPHTPLDEVKDRIEKTTEKACAEALKAECKW